MTVVMISSTKQDLQEHREKARDAVLRSSMRPVMMEHIPAKDADAVRASLELVDQADIYLLIVGNRYGHIPDGHSFSITELEYGRATERGIPRLVHLISEKHPETTAEPESHDASEKLRHFTERLRADRVADFYDSADHLRGNVIDSLVPWRSDGRGGSPIVAIPTPPIPFVPHPYALLETRKLIGRGDELRALDQWLEGTVDVYREKPVLSLNAIGGMGKSALAWKWFTTDLSIRPGLLAARIWWSFYEPGATFENFVLKALAYFGRRTVESIQNIPIDEQLEQLLLALDREPSLMVLDGFERALLAYARFDAPQLIDLQVDRSVTSEPSNRSLRQAADPRCGRFLRRLAQLRRSHVLITTRLAPADLETATGAGLPGTLCFPLDGLNDNGCLELWRSLGCTGSANRLLAEFDAFARHPLLIRALAAVVSRYRKAPGDFDAWLADHSQDAVLHAVPVEEAMGRVLNIALNDLPENCWAVLRTLAAFRMSASYNVLVGLHVGPIRPFESEAALDRALTELEDRGLMGWDRKANRYDLHPVVRGGVWDRMVGPEKTDVLNSLKDHFRAIPLDNRQISCLDDMTPAIELFSALARLGHYDAAFEVLCNSRYEGSLYRYCQGRDLLQLLSLLFPKGTNELPAMHEPHSQATACCMISNAHLMCADPTSGEAAVRLQRRIQESLGDRTAQTDTSIRLAWMLGHTGKLREAQSLLEIPILTARAKKNRHLESRALDLLGIILAIRGMYADAGRACELAEVLTLNPLRNTTSCNYVAPCLVAIYEQDWKRAALIVDKAKESANRRRDADDQINAAVLLAIIRAGSDHHDAASSLAEALALCRRENQLIDEGRVLIEAARLQIKRGDYDGASRYLDDAQPIIERSQIPMDRSDAAHLRSIILESLGEHDAAATFATEAFRAAWCDGPPFAYDRGIRNATARLSKLGKRPPGDLPRTEQPVELKEVSELIGADPIS